MDHPSILYVCRKQFGYSIDNYYHCKYLKEYYNITYLSPDVGWERISIEGVDTVYCSFRRNRIINNLRFYIKALHLIKKKKYRLIILNSSKLFFIFKILNPRKLFIYDIRSGMVYSLAIKRSFYTLLKKFEILFFRNITVISESLAKELKIRKYHILPIGAEKFNMPFKTFEELKLVYVGSFNNRRIEETVEGFALFLKDYNGSKKISYHIYGFGDPASEYKIVQSIKENSLSEIVFFHGKALHRDLPEILNEFNVGISYVPITPYYDFQPPTKTFEYLLAGMPVIATRTRENGKVINHYNGILINDTAEDFRKGLKSIYEEIDKGSFSSAKIREDSGDYAWEKIVNGNFKDYIDSLLAM